MISNMQQQEFDMLNKILKTDNAGLFINNNNNNNNNNTNKNIHMMPSNLVHNQNSSDIIIYDPNIDYFDQSSLNAKEIVTIASQQSFENEPTILIPNNLNLKKDTVDSNKLQLQIKQEDIDQRQEYAFVNNTKKNVNSYVNVKEHQKQKHSVSIINDNLKKTINNQQYHNDTLRCIKDVHNYSKINRFDYSTNSSSQEDDDDDDGYDDYDDDVFKANNNNTSPKSSKYDCNGHNTKILQLKRNGSIDEILLVAKTPRKSSSLAFTPTSLDIPDDDENGEKVTPDHHARRPMNAFLIFCKRHRAIVREKYKHLENRSITKILGEWWAMLDTKDKAFYTELAKQYKDAFFSANPNFKWYKLPAPPLRTLATRPGNADRPLIAANPYYPYANDYETITGIKDAINQSTSIRSPIAMIFDQMENRRNNNFQKSTNVGEFKLADEAQMGSLNSLMCSISSSPNSNGNNQSDNINTNTNNDNNREDRLDHEALQNVLSETSSYISSTMPSSYKDGEPFQNMRDHAIRMENDFIINGKRKNTDFISYRMDGYKKLCTRDNSFSPTTNEIDIVPKKSSRSCKGKKYQEFMNSGQITPFVKKTNPKSRSTSTTFPHNGYCKNANSSPDSGDDQQQQHHHHHFLMQPIKIENPIPDQFLINSNNNYQQQPLDSPTSIKQFDASDFDLEKKIKALPAQSLDDYLLRKHETKKKKKIGSKRRTPSTTSLTLTTKQQNQRSPQTIQEARDRIQSTMVGSQKRKARKESITRRDINTMNSSEQTTANSNSLFETVETLVQLGATVKTEFDIDDDEAILHQPATTNATSDLLILAEVAANHIVDKVEI